MKYAKITPDGIKVAELHVLFPNISFPSTGPSDEFKAKYGLLVPVEHLEYDGIYEKLEKRDPYFNRKGQVLTVEKVDLEPMIIINNIKREITEKLNQLAIELGYDNLLEAISYKTSGVASWQEDARKFSDARDTVWQLAESRFQSFIDGKTDPRTILPEIDKVI